MRNKKMIIILFSTVMGVLLFLEKCTPINISTTDVFRSRSLKYSQNFGSRMKMKNHEVVSVDGFLPIFYDSIQNVFYLKNENGLTKIDANGNIIMQDSLPQEKVTSTYNFHNYIPYVFASKGVYDFSGTTLTFNPFAEIYNTHQDLNDTDFKSLFESLYASSEMVVFDNDDVTERDERYPMYFYKDAEWTLLYCQKGEYRFSHLQYGDLESNTLGQSDFEGFPAKFNNKKLIVLKDHQNGIYTTGVQPKDDAFFDMYYSEILSERELNYESKNEVKRLSYKKLDYYSVGNPFGLANWMSGTFKVKVYYQLTYNENKLFFNADTYKYGGEVKDERSFSLFEVPQKFKKKTNVSFILHTVTLQEEKTSLYIIRPKN